MAYRHIAGIASAAFAVAFAVGALGSDPVTWEGSTNLTMTANTAVEVPDGTTNVIDTLAGAYTLTKTGGGTLEIRYSKSASAKIIISEGTVRFANPRPDEIFANASFHVDASDLSSMTMFEENGTNFVSIWRDRDGRDLYATNCMTVWKCRTNPANRHPFLETDAQNGLPVMNFGSLLTSHNTNDVGAALGYGAAMKFSVSNLRFLNGFTVFADTDDYDVWPTMPEISWKSMAGQSLFASESGQMFYRRQFDSADHRPGLSQDTQTCNRYAASSPSATNFVVDGVQYVGRPKWLYPSPGFHVVEFRPEIYSGTGCYVETFAASRHNSSGDSRSYGGQKIAEWVIFDDYLEEKDRSAVTAYLMAKWFPQSVAAVTVAQGASLVVDDSAKLAILQLTDEGAENLAVTCATNYCNRGLTGLGAHIHLDASATNMMEIVEENGTNFVTRWNDVEGGARYAYPESLTGYYGHRPDIENRKAFINPALTQNGLPVVDLGTALFSNYTNEQGVGYGYGAAFGFSTVSLREYISVISDNEELKTVKAGLDGPSYVAYYSGNSWGGQNEGRRGFTVAGKNPPLFRSVNADSKTFTEGTNLVNNTLVAYTYNPPDGFSVIDLRPTTAVNCNRIGRTLRKDSVMCHDTYGGQRIAEYMVFSSLLEDEKRRRIYNALRNKWFGDVPGTTNFYNNLSLGAASAMTVKYEAVAVTNRLALAGSLAAPTVTAANINVTGTNATVDAALTILDGAALSFARLADGSWPMISLTSLETAGAVSVELSAADTSRLRNSEARLIAMENPPASAAAWSVTSSFNKIVPILSVRADGVWVTFAGKGTVFLLR